MQRLAPSLASHHGCTIIDINPGAGLWSAKLHQHLKPRSHILVEPRKDLYLPWLRPLVEAPASRYLLRDWDEPSCWDPAQYIKEGLLLKDLEKAGTNMGCNNNILIVANWADTSKIKSGKPSGLVKKIVGLTLGMQSKTGFNACGPVRILMWIPGYLRNSALPSTAASRRRFSLKLELACHIEEIIKGTDTKSVREKKRMEFLDVASSIRVLRDMEKSKIQIPHLRQDVTHQRAREFLKASGGTGLENFKDPLAMTFMTTRGWHRELEQLEKDFHDGKFHRFSDVSADKESLTPEYSRLIELQRNWRHIQKNQLTMEELAHEQDVLDSLERDACSDELDALERGAKSKELTYFSERFNTRLEHMSFRIRTQYKLYRDERRAFFRDRPLLMWDRRVAEPVVAHANEVHPIVPFSLLDFQPHPPDLYPLTQEQLKQADFLMVVLFEQPDSCMSSLDSIAPGACDAIIPKVPALRDPLRGGRRDVSLLQANMLTPEMLHGIIKAWDEWSSRPSLTHLLFNREAI